MDKSEIRTESHNEEKRGLPKKGDIGKSRIIISREHIDNKVGLTFNIFSLFPGLIQSLVSPSSKASLINSGDG